MFKRTFAVIAGTCALVLPATAGATPRGTPAERAAGKAYAQAAYVYTKETWEARPALAAALEATRADRVQCRRLEAALERTFMRDESAAGERLYTVAFFRGFAVLEATALPAKERLVAALDAVRGADARLRAGREMWRAEVAFSRVVSALPADTCARLVAWDRGGRRGLPLADVDLGDLERFVGDDDASPGADGRVLPADALERAVRRLRVLGQGPVRAARFGGAPAMRAWRPFLDDVARDLEWIAEVIFKDFD